MLIEALKAPSFPLNKEGSLLIEILESNSGQQTQPQKKAS